MHTTDPEPYELRKLCPHPDAQCTARAQTAADIQCRVHSLMAWDWRQGMSIPRRIADDHLIIFMESGSLLAEFPEQTYTAQRGDCLWIPKGSKRRLSAQNDSLFLATHLDLGPQHTHYHVHEIVSSITPDNVQHLKHILMHSDDPTINLKLATPFFTAFLQQAVLKQIVHASAQSDALIQDCLALLQTDPSLSAELCAQHCGLGITRFRQRFQAACGISPGKYITQLRCHKAADLLRSTERPIAEISFACGYENPNYLYRVFKQQFHCTPQAYRRGDYQLHII